MTHKHASQIGYELGKATANLMSAQNWLNEEKLSNSLICLRDARKEIESAEKLLTAPAGIPEVKP
jgi:hypothetical protein